MAKTTIEQKIARLEAELKNAKAEKSQATRKERSNQLTAFGIMLERKYKTLDADGRAKIRAWLDCLASNDTRNRERVQDGFARLDGSMDDGKDGTEN